MRELTPDRVSDLLDEMGLCLIGDKIAILQDKCADTYGSGPIQVAEAYKSHNLTGTVVYYGTEMDEGRMEYIRLGDKVRYNRIAAVTDRLSFPEGESAEIVIVSSRDVYYSYPDEEGT